MKYDEVEFRHQSGNHYPNGLAPCLQNLACEFCRTGGRVLGCELAAGSDGRTGMTGILEFQLRGV